MRWVKKTHVKLFRLNFSTGGSSRKSIFRLFRLDPPDGRKTQSNEMLSRKSPFSTVCKKKTRMGPHSTKKRPFSTDKLDCVRNGLKLRKVSGAPLS